MAITTVVGDCCCGGTGTECCVETLSFKETIFLTLMAGNCLELHGVSFRMTKFGGAGLALARWFYTEGTSLLGAFHYVYHTEVIAGITYDYGVEPSVLACESACPANYFLFRGLLNFARVARNGASAGIPTSCGTYTFLKDGDTVVFSCEPCNSPLNITGRFTGDPILGCDQTWCQPTFLGTYTE